MRTMRREVKLDVPAKKAWDMYKDNQTISKVNPDMLANASYVQGDGKPGTLRLFKLGPAVSGYVKESLQKIEKVDEEGKSSSYQVVGGQLSELYNPYHVTFSFIPLQGKEDTACVAEWKVVFRPRTQATPPPEQAIDVALNFLACFDNFRLPN